MKRIFGLDVVRAISILWVMSAHYMYTLYPFFGGSGERIYNSLSWIGGYFSVDVFFTLSGFLVGGIFIREFLAVSTEKPLHQARKFWLKRWIRTLPNYYLFLIINILVYSWLEGHSFWYLFPRYALFCQKVDYTTPLPIFGVSWSLAIEEWFYILLPFFFILTHWITRSRKIAFFIPLLLMFVIPTLMKIWYCSSVPQIGKHDEFFKFTSFARLEPIGFGVVLAYLWYIPRWKDYLLQYRRKLAFVAILLFFASMVYGLVFLAKPMQHSVLYAVLSPLSGLSIALTIPYFFMMPQFRFALANKALTFVSILSYSLYLSHILVKDLLEYLLKDIAFFESNIGGVVKLGLLVTVAFGVAILNFYLFEEPILKWRDRLIPRQKNA